MAEIRRCPIPPAALYLFVLIISLFTAALSVWFLLNALREGAEAQAWISVAYFTVASLMAIFFFWWLF
jgi:hypothetical protein